jgi:hypothetical protein
MTSAWVLVTAASIPAMISDSLNTVRSPAALSGVSMLSVSTSEAPGASPTSLK